LSDYLLSFVPFMSEDEQYYVSQEKYDELEEELDYLTNTRRKEIAEDLKKARDKGDLSENAEYDEARDKQAQLEDRIQEIQNILKNVQIVEKTDSDTVQIGSDVTLKKKGSGDVMEYSIVGSEESNLKEGNVSHTSPLGEAIIDREEGDEFTFEAPGGEITYAVKRIE